MGKALMNLAKQKAKEMGCRAMVLETQSCNENAIAFYRAQGFSFFGFDRSCYGNRDIENHEVRLEMGLYMD
jgi:ribosomal protein S18 acetylase RimI-like enzyme